MKEEYVIVDEIIHNLSGDRRIGRTFTKKGKGYLVEYFDTVHVRCEICGAYNSNGHVCPCYDEEGALREDCVKHISFQEMRRELKNEKA